MRWIFAFVLSFLPATAFAQTCLGITPAPPQAVAAGYNCQTYHWGPGDTLSEIDTTGTGVPGKKWYLGTALVNGHATVLGDFSVTGGGKIVTQTSVPADHGAFLLNTCFAPTGSNVWTGGQFFQNGFYAEVVMEWNGTGHPGVQTGFYGFEGYWLPLTGGISFNCPGHAFNTCYEADNPDAFANGQAVVAWGSTGGVQANNPNPLPNMVPTVETGANAYGLLTTPSATTWYFNGATNGTPGTVVFPPPTTSAGDMYTSKQCFGLGSTAEFPLTLDTFDVWQAGVGPTPGGSGVGIWKMLHRR